MSDHFYDAQLKRYLTQFMRAMSNFGYKDAKGQVVQVPVRYGDMNKQVATILRNNTENTIATCPMIACYIKDIQYDRNRLQDPTFVGKIHIREREFDPTSQSYTVHQGQNYTVERIMPSPFNITFVCDIWTSNTDQKFQLWEQMVVLFNPSLEIQSTDNYIDWTSLSVLEFTGQTWTNRTIPQGVDPDIEILSMSFTAPVWITPPAKVKRLGIITKIIASIHTVPTGSVEGEYSEPGAVEMFGKPDAQVVVTPGNYDLLVMNNAATLLKTTTGAGDNIDITDPMNTDSWHKLLDIYPGLFRAGLSQIRLDKPNGNQIVAYVSLDPLDDTRMILNIDPDTVPSNTVIGSRGTVDAIIDPATYDPQNVAAGTRYLILEDININDQYGEPGYSGPAAWKNSDSTDFQAHANDIIEWNGTAWSVIFNSATSTDVVYITNSYTGVQYKWDGEAWTKSFEGVYDKLLWRLVL